LYLQIISRKNVTRKKTGRKTVHLKREMGWGPNNEAGIRGKRSSDEYNKRDEWEFRFTNGEKDRKSSAHIEGGVETTVRGKRKRKTLQVVRRGSIKGGKKDYREKETN